jgi:hypothetical protein
MSSVICARVVVWFLVTASTAAAAARAVESLVTARRVSFVQVLGRVRDARETAVSPAPFATDKVSWTATDAEEAASISRRAHVPSVPEMETSGLAVSAVAVVASTRQRAANVTAQDGSEVERAGAATGPGARHSTAAHVMAQDRRLSNARLVTGVDTGKPSLATRAMDKVCASVFTAMETSRYSAPSAGATDSCPAENAERRDELVVHIVRAIASFLMLRSIACGPKLAPLVRYLRTSCVDS